MNPNVRLKKKIAEGKVCLGAWATLGHAGIAEIFARAGYDWVVVDLEHSVMSIETAAEMIRAIDLCGSAPLVRPTSNDPDLIKRVMDHGAHGLVVPMVNTAEDARRAAAAMRYAPAGNRGVGLGRAQGYGAAFNEYFEWQTDQSVLIVQIEHKDALDNLDEILTVPGVDGFVVGPYDLSCSMGLPGQFDHPDFVAALARILAAGKRHDVHAGLHIVEPDARRLRGAIEEGYRFIAYGVDIRYLDAGARGGIAIAKELIS